MRYKEMFTEEEILAFENQILKLMKKSRNDFLEPLWDDFNFVIEAIQYFDYKQGIYSTIEFISDKFFSNMFIVCALIDNIWEVHNFIALSLIYERIPLKAWYDETFLYNVVCNNYYSLEYIPNELLTIEVVKNALSQVPRLQDFDENGYLNGYMNIIYTIPNHKWGDQLFIGELKIEIIKIYNFINRPDDLKTLLELIDSKITY